MSKSPGKNQMVSNPLSPARTIDPRNVGARDQIQDYNDPDIPEYHLPDDTVCSRCGAVYRRRHWTFDDARRDLIVAAGSPTKTVICPGCKITIERNPHGIVTLAGDYWPEHRDDLLNLVRNEEKSAMRDNPLERIIEIREENGRLVIETTKEKLAQRIGRAIHGAHKGELDYRWPDDDQLVRVSWERKLP